MIYAELKRLQIISSSVFKTFFLKWIFPFVWEGFLVFIAFTMPENQMSAPVIFLLIVFAGFGIFVWCGFLRLPDRVEDHGAYLIVRRGGVEQKIEVVDIKSVSKQYGRSSYSLLLELKKPCAMGREIEFYPARPFPGWSDDVFYGLSQRVERTRRLQKGQA